MNNRTRVVTASVFVGRLLIATLFLISGVGLIAGFSAIATDMAHRGIPLAEPLLVLTIALWLAGGVCLLLGWKARPAAVLIALVMIPVTICFHAPWAAEPAEFQNKMNHFLMNLAIIGGLLQIAGFGPGTISLDERRAVASAA